MKELRKDLWILKMTGLKPNYSALSRKHSVSRNTVRKYDSGYQGKAKTRKKASRLDRYRDEISEKINVDGVFISSVYQYLRKKHEEIGSESNFRKYVKKHGLKKQKEADAHPRFETPYGYQMQFDWKEDMKMTSRHGELFEFNVLTSVLSCSRMHVFEYSRTMTRQDVKACLMETFRRLGGVPEEALTDNMSSIDTNGRLSEDMRQFAKDFGFRIRRCRPISPFTKGKVESKNRFLNWLKPYDGEFEDEQDLIRVIREIEEEANRKPNGTTMAPPSLLYEKEKEHLQELPNERVFDWHQDQRTPAKVTCESLVTFKGCRYSVPMEYISKTVQLKAEGGMLSIYYTGKLIQTHPICGKRMNYDRGDYEGIMRSSMWGMDDSVLKRMVSENLTLLDGIGGERDV